LIVDRITVGGVDQDDIWNASARAHLAYCINQSSFGSNYAAVQAAISEAASGWNGVIGARVEYRADQDSACTATNSNVVFNVAFQQTLGATARSFLPVNARPDRQILLGPAAFNRPADLTLAGVFRHELGHTLGFRHEFIRQPNPPVSCQETVP